jgi:hypothetical protein
MYNASKRIIGGKTVARWVQVRCPGRTGILVPSVPCQHVLFQGALAGSGTDEPATVGHDTSNDQLLVRRRSFTTWPQVKCRAGLWSNSLVDFRCSFERKGERQQARNKKYNNQDKIRRNLTIIPHYDVAPDHEERSSHRTALLRRDLTMPLADIPVEVFLDNLLPLAEVRDVLSLGSTNNFFAAVCADETFWRRKCLEDFNFTGQETARQSGWKNLYRGLSYPRIFVWGFVTTLVTLIRLHLTRIVTRSPFAASAAMADSA